MRVYLHEPQVVNDVSRKIVHIDMDAFYASIEQRDRPELRGKAIAVGHAAKRGVVATASYEARCFGVRSAMPSMRAKELCPNLIFVEGRMHHYKAVSAQVHEILRRYADLIEPISIDEAFLDVTDNKLGLEFGLEVARCIKGDIRRELNLVASAGISYNKFLAKIASDWRKPDGLCTIHPDKAQAFIDELPIEAFWGVGPATAKRFRQIGVATGRALRAMPFAVLEKHFGSMAMTFYKFARGIDDRPVLSKRERKSVGREETYVEDVRGNAAVLEKIRGLAHELERRMKRAGFAGLTLTLKIRSPSFETKTRSFTSGTPFLSEASILAGAKRLLESSELPAAGVRLLGLTVSTPVDLDDIRQETLF